MAGMDYASLVTSMASSASQLYAANAAKEIGKYNQSLYNISAGVIEANNKYQKKLFAEERKRTMGTGIATLTAQNVGVGRTSLSLLNKSMENLYIDEAFSDYNAKMSALQARSGGVQAMAQGKARSASYISGAANTASQGIANFAIKQKKQGAK